MKLGSYWLDTAPAFAGGADGPVDGRDDQAPIATGAAAQGPLGRLRRRIVPAGRLLVVSEPLEPALPDRIMPKRRNDVTSKTIRNYLRLTPDNRLLVGGRERFAISNPRSDVKGGHCLQATPAEAFPKLAGVRIDYCWSRLVDTAIDRLPWVGAHGGLFYAMGYSGRGAQDALH